MGEFVQIDIDEYKRLIELNESRRNQIDGLSVALAESKSKCEMLLRAYFKRDGFDFLLSGKTFEELTDLTSEYCFVSSFRIIELMQLGFRINEIQTALSLVVRELKDGTEQQ